MEIQSLSNTNFDVIFEAFNQAFADYEMQLNKTQLQTMLKRRGFNLNLSFAAFGEGKIMAFTLNGIGNFGETQTAYDTGTGTLKAYRGQGLATQIFEYSIPYLQEAGIKQYLLEVLQHNTSAISVYKNLGFEVIREFYYSMQDNEQICKTTKTDFPYSVQPINILSLKSLSGFWDFAPSWQNSLESINRMASDFICLGAFSDEQPVGYCVFEPVSGDVTQIAVNKQFRRNGIASMLLKEMQELNKTPVLKVINTDITCDSINDFLKAKNIEIKGKQFEMMRKI